jgi:hypothetical protein
MTIEGKGGASGPGPAHPSGLEEEDELLLLAWRRASYILYPQLEAKSVFAIALRSMLDPEWRALLLSDQVAALAELPEDIKDLPEGLLFHDPRDGVVHVVLPPPAGSAYQDGEDLADLLVSGTRGARAFQDDWDTGWNDPLGSPDPDFRDEGPPQPIPM